MRTLVLALSLSILFPVLTFPSLAGEVVVYKSASPTCYTIIREHGMERTIPGYETRYRLTNHHGLFHRQCDFLGNPDALMSDIGWPADGSYPVNGDRGNATNITVLPNGHIKISY